MKTAILTLDRLWVDYSNGIYGFSVQKQIYVDCGGKLDFSFPSDETWEKFCDRIAWKSEGKWVSYPEQFFKKNFMWAKGHLPSNFDPFRDPLPVTSLLTFPIF
ncbi:MAG: GUN4 domain-containing protein [Pseudanabaena sp.]